MTLNLDLVINSDKIVAIIVGGFNLYENRPQTSAAVPSAGFLPIEALFGFGLSILPVFCQRLLPVPQWQPWHFRPINSMAQPRTSKPRLCDARS